MEYKLSHLPFVKIIIPFISGIFFWNYFNIPIYYLIVSCIAFILLLIIAHNFSGTKSIRTLSTVGIAITIFLIGGLLNASNNFINQHQHFSLQKGQYAKGILYKPLEEKAKTYKTFIAVHQLIDSNTIMQHVTGNLLVYLEKDSSLSRLEIGDEVLFALHYKPVDSIKNPAQFDYKQFLSYKAVYHQQYIKAHEIAIIKSNASALLWIKRISHRISNTLQSILRIYIKDKEHFALADGILLGHRAEIDEELYNAFAYTGIMHILSVSGLHVGIIYGMLLFFLNFIKDRNQKIKIAKFIFVFLFIWMFAFVTGFSPACVRAAILFSLLNFGNLMKENYSSLNLLAGAAFLQLLINPNSIFEIGFQLSYLAMLGLILFTKPIYSLYYSSHRLIDWTWKLWSASIAAQLFTVPLSIYYFGNFPTYFLLANIFAIPMSAIILWLNVFIVVFSFIPFVAKILGWLNSHIIDYFIQFTKFISNLPLGKIYNLYLSKEQLYLLLIAIVSLSFFVMLKKSRFLFTTLAIFFITILISYAYSIQTIKQQNIILYSVANNFVLGIKENNFQYLLSKDSISKNDYSFNIKNAHRKFQIQSYETILLNDSTRNNEHYFLQQDFIYALGKSFYFLNKHNTRKQFPDKLKVDYLILSDNCYLDINHLKENFEYSQLLISSDNDYKHLNIYRKLLKKAELAFLDLSQQSLIIQ